MQWPAEAEVPIHSIPSIHSPRHPGHPSSGLKPQGHHTPHAFRGRQPASTKSSSSVNLTYSELTVSVPSSREFSLAIASCLARRSSFAATFTPTRGSVQAAQFLDEMEELAVTNASPAAAGAAGAEEGSHNPSNNNSNNSNAGVMPALPRPPSLRKQLSPLHSRGEEGSSSPVMLTPVVEAPFDEPITPLPPLTPSLQPLPEDREISDLPEEDEFEEEDEVEAQAQTLPEEAGSSVFDNVPPRPSRECVLAVLKPKP